MDCEDPALTRCSQKKGRKEKKNGWKRSEAVFGMGRSSLGRLQEERRVGTHELLRVESLGTI